VASSCDNAANGAQVTRRQTITDKIAQSILAHAGIAAIWQPQVAAGDADRAGHPHSADAILEIADAGEAAWLEATEHLRDRLDELTSKAWRDIADAVERLLRT
jgi:hypothetical protein